MSKINQNIDDIISTLLDTNDFVSPEKIYNLFKTGDEETKIKAWNMRLKKKIKEQ